MNKCPNCKAQLGAQSTSCGICGTDLIQEPIYTVVPPAPPKEQEEVKSGEIKNSSENTPPKVTYTESDCNRSALHLLKAVKGGKEQNQHDEAEKPKASSVFTFKKKAEANATKSAVLEKVTAPQAEDDSRSALPKSDFDWLDASNDDIEFDKASFGETIKTVMIRPFVKRLHTFFFKTKDETQSYPEEDIKDNANFSVLSYLFYLFFIPMIVKPYSGYLRFHGNQGLTLFLTSLALELVNLFLNFIWGKVFVTEGILNGLGIFFTVLTTVLINASILLWTAVGIYNAVKGKARELPLIGRFRMLK